MKERRDIMAAGSGWRDVAAGFSLREARNLKVATTASAADDPRDITASFSLRLDKRSLKAAVTEDACPAETP